MHRAIIPQTLHTALHHSYHLLGTSLRISILPMSSGYATQRTWRATLAAITTITDPANALYYDAPREIYEAWMLYNFLALLLAYIGCVYTHTLSQPPIAHLPHQRPGCSGDEDGWPQPQAIAVALHMLPATTARQRPVCQDSQALSAAVCVYKANPCRAQGRALLHRALGGGQLVTSQWVGGMGLG